VAAPELVFVRHYIIGDDVIRGLFCSLCIAGSHPKFQSVFSRPHRLCKHKRASWLFLFDTVAERLCPSITLKACITYIILIFNLYKAFNVAINNTYLNENIFS